jgi:hypothetical protein
MLRWWEAPKMKRWLGPVIATLLVAASCCACSPYSKDRDACQTVIEMVGPTVPNTIPVSSAKQLLEKLVQSGDPAFAGEIAELRSAVRSGNQREIFQAVDGVDVYCSTHYTGPRIT